MKRYAIISDDGLYRYRLDRMWDDGKPAGCWIMLNPSKADAVQDDPTIMRILGFSQGWRYGRLIVVNLFAFRATKPADLFAADYPAGEHGLRFIESAVDESASVFVAWGSCGAKSKKASEMIRMRSRVVLDLLEKRNRVPFCLGRCNDGSPRHPLMVRGDVQPEIYKGVLT